MYDFLAMFNNIWSCTWTGNLYMVVLAQYKTCEPLDGLPGHIWYCHFCWCGNIKVKEVVVVVVEVSSTDSSGIEKIESWGKVNVSSGRRRFENLKYLSAQWEHSHAPYTHRVVLLRITNNSVVIHSFYLYNHTLSCSMKEDQLHKSLCMMCICHAT